MKLPTLAELRRYAQDHQLKRAILLYEIPTGQIGYVSWGWDKKQCQGAKDLADQCYELAHRRSNQ